MDDPATPPRRKTHHLAIGRRSEPGATYFVTECTHDRRPGLTGAAIAPDILHAILNTIGRDHLLIATLMPDHIHLLFQLGTRLSLSDTLTQLKLRSAPAFARGNPKLSWQRNFFDRRVRANESLESYALYVFLNPYRAGLLPLEARWPGTILGQTAPRFRFLDSFETTGAVPPEWLSTSDQWERGLGFSLGDRKQL